MISYMEFTPQENCWLTSCVALEKITTGDVFKFRNRKSVTERKREKMEEIEETEENILNRVGQVWSSSAAALLVYHLR